MKRGVACLFALFCFINIYAQYKDASAFDLKGRVKSCTVYCDDRKDGSYTFAANGKCLTVDNRNFLDIYSNVKRDNHNRIISAIESISSGLFGFIIDTEDETTKLIIKWSYDSYGRLVKKSTLTQKDKEDDAAVESYSDINGDGFYTHLNKNGTDYYCKDHQADSHGNWISYNRCDNDGTVVCSYRRAITYWDNSTSKNISTPRPSTSNPTVSTPSASQNEINVIIKGTRLVSLLPVDNKEREVAFQANVYVNGAEGKDVTFKISRYCKSLEGSSLDDTRNDSPLKECGSKTCNATYNSTHWENMTINVPISDLHLIEGNQALAFELTVYIDGKQMGETSGFSNCLVIVHNGNVENFSITNKDGVAGDYYE
jgi:hypothetical protein